MLGLGMLLASLVGMQIRYVRSWVGGRWDHGVARLGFRKHLLVAEGEVEIEPAWLL